MDAEQVKSFAKSLGADLVGIAAADTLNAFPPDPLWPQAPERISESCRSVIVCRIPVAVFRAKSSASVQYMDLAVLRELD